MSTEAVDVSADLVASSRRQRYHTAPTPALPPPPAGEGGEGEATHTCACGGPLPNPPPQAGGGGHRPRSLRQQRPETSPATHPDEMRPRSSINPCRPSQASNSGAGRRAQEGRASRAHRGRTCSDSPAWTSSAPGTPITKLTPAATSSASSASMSSWSASAWLVVAGRRLPIGRPKSLPQKMILQPGPHDLLAVEQIFRPDEADHAVDQQAGGERARHRIGARLQGLLVDAVMGVRRQRACPGPVSKYITLSPDACRGGARAPPPRAAASSARSIPKARLAACVPATD